MTMLSIRNILSASLLLTLLSPCIQGQEQATKWEDKDDIEAFQKLLDQVDPPSLHEALHSFSPKKFKHGMFQEDRTAVEVIHKEEPSLATSIINLAKRQRNDVVDLSKRQGGDISNGTSATTTPASPSPQSTSRVTPVAPISELSTPATNQVTSATTTPAASNSPTASTSVIDSSNVSSSSSSITSSGASITSISSSGPNSSSISISLTAGELLSTTNGAGVVIISTVGAGASTISPTTTDKSSTNTHIAAAQTSVVVQTSTLPNGSKSVVTAVTVVAAGNSAVDTPSGTAGVGPTTAAASPGLQTGEAVMTRGWGKEMVLVVGGAVVFAGMM